MPSPEIRDFKTEAHAALSAAAHPAVRGNTVEAPPFSLALVAGLLLRPLPQAPIQGLVSLALRVVMRRHPEVFARLQPLGPVSILIDVTDLPFGFEFRPSAAGDKLLVRQRDVEWTGTAIIRGPLAALLDLLQGTCDGDALFFSRILTVEGDTTCVLALRNAIDSAEIDLAADLISAFGPARRIAERAFRLPVALGRALARDTALVQSAILGPLVADLRQQATGVAELRRRVESLAAQRVKQRA